LLISPPLSASLNMAVDEAIFNVSSCPTLRFYRWNSPSISVGYFQRIDKGFLDSCSRMGVPVVRRPTGGRAILHHSEITYSLVSPYNLFPGPSALTNIYKKLARWQVDSLSALGLKADMGERRGNVRPYQKSESCFMTSTPYEVHVGGRKICGSAQKRGKTSFLQHGSILVDVDLELMQKLMGKEEDSAVTFTTLKREGYERGIDHAIHVMVKSFSHVMGCSLKNGELSRRETLEMERLEKAHYGDLTAVHD